MPIDCDPAAVVAASKCWNLDPSIRDQVELYLLATAAGLPTDKAGVAAAVAASRCWNIDKSLVEQTKLYLLCAAANQ